MDIFEHPGNLGPTRGTLLTVHHADWPAYPGGNDFRTSALQLTAAVTHIAGCRSRFRLPIDMGEV